MTTRAIADGTTPLMPALNRFPSKERPARSLRMGRNRPAVGNPDPTRTDAVIPAWTAADNQGPPDPADGGRVHGDTGGRA